MLPKPSITDMKRWCQIKFYAAGNRNNGYYILSMMRTDIGVETEVERWECHLIDLPKWIESWIKYGQFPDGRKDHE